MKRHCRCRRRMHMQNKSSQRTGSRDITGHRRRNPPGGTGKSDQYNKNQYNKNKITGQRERKSYLNPKLSENACHMMKRRMYLQNNAGSRKRNRIGYMHGRMPDSTYKYKQHNNNIVTGHKERKSYLNPKLSDVHCMMKRKMYLKKKIRVRGSQSKESWGKEKNTYQGSQYCQQNGKNKIYKSRKLRNAQNRQKYKSANGKPYSQKSTFKNKGKAIAAKISYMDKKIMAKISYVDEKVTEKVVFVNKKMKNFAKSALRVTNAAVLKYAKQKAQFEKDAVVSAVKGQIQSLKGGEELLESVDIIKKTAQETVSFVKTAVDTGKSMYHAGKKTAEVITGVTGGRKRMAGVRGRTEYTEKKLRSSHKKRENQNHIDKKNKGNSRDAAEPESKKEKRKKKEKQKNQSIAKQRILTYIQNKSSGKQQDSLGSVAKDIVKNKAKQLALRAAGFLGKKLMIVIGGAIGGIMSSALPVIIIVALLVQSPFAIFLTGDDKGSEENIQDVLYEYYVEFSNNIQKEADEDGYDKIQLKTSAGEVDGTNAVTTDNFKDVLCVFAEKYGYDDEIMEVTKGTKKKLKKVFQDMNSYSVSTKTKTKTKKNGQQVTKKIKTITITQKNWLEMADGYHFSEESKEELEELLGLAEEEGIGKELEIYTACASGDTCIDGKIYDDPSAPVYSGSCARLAKKTRNYIRPILKSKGMEPYIDIIVSMVQQESTFGIEDNANWMQVNGYSGAAGMESVKAGINHFKGMLDICKRKHITDIYLLIQSYNMGPGYIDYALANGGKDTKEIQRKFQYVQRPDGRYGTVGYSQSVMSRVKGQEPKTGTMPKYFQTDAQWNGVRFGTSTIGKSGCGVCSLSMVISYWTGKEVTPKILVERCHSYYVKGSGASWSMIPAIASQYNLRCKDLGTSKEAMVEELKKGHTIIAIMHQGYFTKGGHFIVLRAIDKNGNISVNDCGSRARTAKTYTAEFIQSNNASNYWAIYK